MLTIQLYYRNGVVHTGILTVVGLCTVTIVTWTPSIATHLVTYLNKVDHGPIWLERLRICAYFLGSFGRYLKKIYARFHLTRFPKST